MNRITMANSINADFGGRVAIVTGAASGIGREAARLYAARARGCSWPT